MGDYYIIETTGDVRHMWGPYPTEARARAQCGTRHAAVRGSACRERTWRRGELQAAQESGGVMPLDPGVELA